MSRIVVTGKRGTQPLGRRPLPNIDHRQCDHSIVRELGNSGIREMERQAADNCSAYLRSVLNPSLPRLEGFVLMVLKEYFPGSPALQEARWATGLPPSVQRVINDHWHLRDHPYDQFHDTRPGQPPVPPVRTVRPPLIINMQTGEAVRTV